MCSNQERKSLIAGRIVIVKKSLSYQFRSFLLYIHSVQEDTKKELHDFKDLLPGKFLFLVTPYFLNLLV